jgi:HTH-type transcriptional regulator, transcriptional repressor of NAD biosynthesis genes
MVKICLYGPESVGKSVMAKQLAKMFNTNYVPEISRDMVTTNQFSESDIIAIGKAQTSAIIEAEKTANQILFCDTDLITTQIYSQQYLNKVPKILFELEKKVKYDLYFLLNIDVLWVADGLRDLGEIRDEMFVKFKAALDSRNIDYVVVSGNWDQRLTKIIETISTKYGLLPIKI